MSQTNRRFTSQKTVGTARVKLVPINFHRCSDDLSGVIVRRSNLSEPFQYCRLVQVGPKKYTTLNCTNIFYLSLVSNDVIATIHPRYRFDRYYSCDHRRLKSLKDRCDHQIPSSLHIKKTDARRRSSFWYIYYGNDSSSRWRVV